MDSTPSPLKPSVHKSKLPIKRKTPEQDPINPPLPAKITPPFKSHRIWTDSDEISFLQGLLHSGLSLPKDLPLFYRRFSSSMSKPYSYSQLSDKLRRLRNKFRVLSSRLSRGLHPSLLSPHHRALFSLSAQLWSLDYASSSHFDFRRPTPPAADDLGPTHTHATVNVSFSPDLPLGSSDLLSPNHDGDGDHANSEKTSEVNVECDLGHGDGGGGGGGGGGFIGAVARSFLDVFDECLKEVLAKQGLICLDNRKSQGGETKDMETRWREQRVAELDVFKRRMRLVVENSLNGKVII